MECGMYYLPICLCACEGLLRTPRRSIVTLLLSAGSATENVSGFPRWKDLIQSSWPHDNHTARHLLVKISVRLLVLLASQKQVLSCLVLPWIVLFCLRLNTSTTPNSAAVHFVAHKITRWEMSFNESSAHEQQGNLLQWTARYGTLQVQKYMQPVSNSPRNFTRAGCSGVCGLCFCLVGTSLVHSSGTTELRPNLGSWFIQHQCKSVEASQMHPQKSKLRIRPGIDIHSYSADQHTAFHLHSASLQFINGHRILVPVHQQPSSQRHQSEERFWQV